MRRLAIFIPLCALLISPAAEKDGDKPFVLEIKPFVDDGAALPDAAGLEKLAAKDPVAFPTRKPMRCAQSRWPMAKRRGRCSFSVKSSGKKVN